MKLRKIGIVNSPYKNQKNTPDQGKFSNQETEIEILPEYVEGIQGIEKLDYILVMYWGDQSNREKIKTIPRGGKERVEKGVFATRSPNRPNPIALCVCKIIKVKDNIITVKGLDALDQSPVLDIKIYVSELDSI